MDYGLNCLRQTERLALTLNVTALEDRALKEVLLLRRFSRVPFFATLCSPPGSYPQDSPGKNTGVGCHSLLQGIFLTQRLNPGVPHFRQILYPLSHELPSWLRQLKGT